MSARRPAAPPPPRKRSPWPAIGGIVALILAAGGAFLIMQGPDRARITRAVEAADSELAQPTVDRDSLRAVLGELRQVAAEEGDTEALTIARSAVLARLGDARGAWEEVAGAVLAPGASVALRAAGARRLTELFAVTGDLEQGARALALAEGASADGGDAELDFLAWQSAFRVGDVDAFRRLTTRLVGSPGDSGDVVDATARVLARLLALRRGVVVDGAGAAEGGGGDLAAWIASLPATTVDALERLGARFDPRTPELEIATAYLALEAAGSAEGDVLSEIYEQGERLTEVVQRLPASIEARLAAVVALVLVADRRGELDAKERRLLGSHVDWLLGNAPGTHAQRDFWTQIQARMR